MAGERKAAEQRTSTVAPVVRGFKVDGDEGGGAAGVPAGGRDGVRGGMGLVYFMRLRLGQLHNLNYFGPSRVPVAALELARTQALALNEPAHHG